MISAKELKKLADACRKAGIKHYKQGDLEFTLTDDAPVSNYKKKQDKPFVDTSSHQIETDSLSEEELLFWSVGDIDGANTPVEE